MIYLNQLLFKVSNDEFGGYRLSIDERNHFLADAKADIVRTCVDILRTGTDKMIF